MFAISITQKVGNCPCGAESTSSTLEFLHLAGFSSNAPVKHCADTTNTVGEKDIPKEISTHYFSFTCL